ncbi:MAG TPA: hypothetical protein VGJ60_07605 [Chloroflexota bacterium]|jgi:hypothetical protein
MPAVQLGSQTGGAAATGVAVAAGGLTPPSPLTTLLIFTIALPTAGAVTSITFPSGTATTTRLAFTTSGARALEIWIAYNFSGGAPTSYTVNFTGGGTAASGVSCVWVDSDLSQGAPTATAGTPTSGTSVTADSGTITPAVGDLVIAATTWANNTASTARASTGNTFVNNGESGSSTTIRTAVAYASATAANLSRLQWTITSAAWLGLIVNLSHFPASPTPVAAFVYKGRDSNTADAGVVA